ncbi:MAG: hypothetical protein P1U69_13815 [Parvibaculaceae bacterium]|nr:hypothetical protein [Parvibaculaceae bacterium]|tara:strand:+ start:3650 stop:3988 length:339 start_codon:yes stop_codon:yes gene_type:complete
MSFVRSAFIGAFIIGGVVGANQMGISVPGLTSNKTEFVTVCKTAKHRPTHRLLGGQRITDAERTELCECMYTLLSSGDDGDKAVELILQLPVVKANGYYDPVREQACYVPHR